MGQRLRRSGNEQRLSGGGQARHGAGEGIHPAPGNGGFQDGTEVQRRGDGHDGKLSVYQSDRI